MGKRIYVGNLPWSMSNADLEELFGAHGNVRMAEVMSDRETGRSRGFGFVEMDSDESMNSAIDALNGKEVDGRPLVVNEARPKTPGGGGGYGGGGGGRSGGGRSGGGRGYR
ncbi:MAG: RNA-binding protein [Pirellulales bacterium]|nr:RNA-binding protein [Pirellulales bacterium]